MFNNFWKSWDKCSEQMVMVIPLRAANENVPIPDLFLKEIDIDFSFVEKIRCLTWWCKLQPRHISLVTNMERHALSRILGIGFVIGFGVIWDTSLGLGYLGFRFWDLGYLGYKFWDLGNTYSHQLGTKYPYWCASSKLAPKDVCIEISIFCEFCEFLIFLPDCH